MSVMRDYTYLSGMYPGTYQVILRDLAKAPAVAVGEWHAVDVSGSPAHVTHELTDVTLAIPVGHRDVKQLALMTDASMPWAEDHFQERVSGEPLNPPESSGYWPHGDTLRHTDGKVFSHTYPERIWPKHAGSHVPLFGNSGIRFPYGDLDDLIILLTRNPLTRQAYLPIWFPEDLAAGVDQERVPCSLGYHFMVRDNTMTVRYFMRSCEFKRHLRDDLYMAARLLQYVCQGVNDSIRGTIHCGQVIAHITSLHILRGDL